MDNTKNIPVEKFQFAKRNDLLHDSKFETKPVSYFQGAFKRFSKNKGAVVGGVVIAVLVLFAIFAPLFTPFQPAYYDMVYAYVTPKSNLFANSGIDFWDGYKEKETNLIGYLKDVALAEETGREIIKRGEYEVSEDGSTYSYRYDTYAVLALVSIRSSPWKSGTTFRDTRTRPADRCCTPSSSSRTDPLWRRTSTMPISTTK